MTRETLEQRLDLLSPRFESKIAALVEEYRTDLSSLQSAAPSRSSPGASLPKVAWITRLAHFSLLLSTYVSANYAGPSGEARRDI